jgi:putative transposase
MHEELGYNGETASPNRVARLMARHGLFSLPKRRPFRNKRTGVRPDHARNHLELDFVALESDSKWVTDIDCIYKGKLRLNLCTVLDLYRNKMAGWSMLAIQNRHTVIKTVLMACRQRPDREFLVRYSDRGTQFASGDHPLLLVDHRTLSSMSAVGHCADNAAAEGFCGRSNERIHRHGYLTLADTRVAVFDDIERFHNPWMQRNIGT